MPSRTTLAQLYGAAILTGVGFTMSPLLMAGVIAFLMLTWRTGWQLLEHQRSKLRQREDEFVAWVLASPPIRLSGASAIFTAASTGIPLGLSHHLRHNRVLHERGSLISSFSTDEPRVEP